MALHQLDLRAGRMLDLMRLGLNRQSVPVRDVTMAPAGGPEAPFAPGGAWGAKEWCDFRFRVTVPESFRDKTVVRIRTGREAEWEAVNPQFEVYLDGRIAQAFDTKHTTLVLPTEPGRTFSLLLHAYCPPLKPGQQPPVFEAHLDEVNAELEQLIYDLTVPLETARVLPEDSRDRELLLEEISRALDLLDQRRPHSPAFDASVAEARAYLARHLYGALTREPAQAWADCVGHTHIDVAWLWDLEQTRHKAVRSFSTVLNLMERYPEYRFMSSTPALYQMVKEDEPELYGRIRRAVAEGRWEPEGGTWVEPDCNLPSGESLIRQFLEGQKFFRGEFGRPSAVLWLPDVFGYCAALPQIMRQCGIRYFMTTKISWSEFNRLPYDTFTWQGLDGSEVLAHFSPAREFAGGRDVETGLRKESYTTYNAKLTPGQMAGGWQRFQQKGIDNEFLVSYGFGDGGGGPTDWMLENARRMAKPLPGLPAVRQMFPSEFFRRLEERMRGEKRLPKWCGELYLEYHRGTYTSQGHNKRNNRKIEQLLRETELWSARAAHECPGFAYPDLTGIWRDVLTLQFHDILPGSAIRKVYEDSDAMYARMFGELNALVLRAKRALADRLAGDVLFFNSFARVRSDVVWFDAPEDVTALVGSDGRVHPVQHAEGRAVVFVDGLAPMAATAFRFSREPVRAEALAVSTDGFETPFFTGRFDRQMRIVSLRDREADREVARAPLNRLTVYENKPHNFDAWDMNIYYDRRSFPVDEVLSAEVVANGPVVGILRVRYRYMDSTVTQDVVLYHDLKRVDFVTEADWREPQTLLKAHFPVDVFHQEATFDVQFGNVRRPTHRNTSWDAARFEVCGHQWADVSEDGYGVSVLNDCKYGWGADEEGLSLSLIKCSIYPDPAADVGRHAFTYSLAPHYGGWREADIPTAAHALNTPVTALPGGGTAAEDRGFSVDAPNVFVEAVKRAEDGRGVIVRMNECFGRRTQMTLDAGRQILAAETVNALEEEPRAERPDGSALRLTLRPYEIRTVRLILA